MELKPPGTINVDAKGIAKGNMDRNTNLKAMCAVSTALDREAIPEEAINLRRALYMHYIIEAMLSERIDLIPSSCLEHNLPKARTS